MRIRTAALACLLLLALPLPRAAQSQTATVKLATLVPDGSVWDKILRDMGAEWRAATAGRVRLVLYPGGVAGDEPDIVRRMRIGQIHAAALTITGLSQIDPSFQVFGVPMFFDSYEELAAVLEAMEPTLRRRLEDKGFVLLNWGHGGWVHLFTREPVSTLDRLKQSKMFVWAGDDQMVQLWRANGFQPVALAATDILTGLQTGMIEAFPCPPVAALAMQWYHSAPSMIGLGLGPLVGGTVITRKTWNRISTADRARLLEICAKAEARLAREVPLQDTLSVVEMERRGLRVTHIPPANLDEWRAAAESFAAGMRGTIVPEDVLDLARAERDSFRERHGSQGSR